MALTYGYSKYKNVNLNYKIKDLKYIIFLFLLFIYYLFEYFCLGKKTDTNAIKILNQLTSFPLVILLLLTDVVCIGISKIFKINIFEPPLIVEHTYMLFNLFLGMLILGPIMKSAEVETIYLPITLNFLTFVLSFALTMVFTIVTDKLMNRRLRKIDMIESLKSVE